MTATQAYLSGVNKIAVAILAAGRGSRMGSDTPKPLVKLHHQTLLQYALTAAIDSGLAPVLLVVGYEGETVAATAPPGVTIIHNPHWQQGIATSLHSAISHLQNHNSVTAVCIGLADQPFIGAQSYQRLQTAYLQTSNQNPALFVATYAKARRNPVLIPRSLWQDALELQGDEGARQLMKTYPVVEVGCDETGDPFDIDTPANLVQGERPGL
ncbi:MAG TPA: nucleotidyltransferase family protein [Oscillatoriaceae cyanobacterium M33_DOE_052]|uniref:Nucleotidyltransferase family protein n=1 Tax=Planktothricoides sp. SpSt-374 TaxID=2282167 RepID=A0A7C3ZNU3_9CYAN|nr:nucleotidyltransferase family protein [Oscillatoriaceae cyanobacterium M33_DOE_052]